MAHLASSRLSLVLPSQQQRGETGSSTLYTPAASRRQHIATATPPHHTPGPAPAGLEELRAVVRDYVFQKLVAVTIAPI
jgi:hypothetical protein